MIRIEIDSTNVQEFKGESKTTGRAYHIRKQEGYAFTLDKGGNVAKYPVRFAISLDENQTAYPVGVYELHASSVYVDRQGQMTVRPRLAPVRAVAKAST